MSEAVLRAVRAGLLISPDTGMEGPARIAGFVLHYHPGRGGEDDAVNALVAQLTSSSPRCLEVLRAVAEATARRSGR